MSKSTRPCDQKVFETFLGQLKPGKNGRPSLNMNCKVPAELQDYFNDTTTQLPDMTIEQINQALKEIENVTGNYTSINTTQDYLKRLLEILPNYPSSEYQIKLNDDEIYTLYRLPRSKFTTIYSQLKSGSKAAAQYLKDIIPEPDNDYKYDPEKVIPTNISLTELKLLSATYSSQGAQTKKTLDAYYNFLTEHMLTPPKIIECECQANVMQTPDQLNFIYETQTFPSVDENTPVVTYSQVTEMIQNYTTIKYRAQLNQCVYTMLTETLPLLMIKSHQIKTTFPDVFKTARLKILNFDLPLYYTLNDDQIYDKKHKTGIVKQVNDLHITQPNQDYHLQCMTSSNKVKPLHQVIKHVLCYQHSNDAQIVKHTPIYVRDETYDVNQILHHINGNHFDNRAENIISIQVTPSNEQYMTKINIKPNAFSKHQMIHAIMQEFCEQIFYTNVINLQKFYNENSYYQDMIYYINNTERLKINYESSYGKRTLNKDLEIINEFFTNVNNGDDDDSDE